MVPTKASRLATAQTASEPRKVVPHPGENTFDAIKIEGKAQTRERGTVDGNGVEGGHFGAWVPLKADPTGKRIACIFSCNTIRLVAVDALQIGMNRGFGCLSTPRATERSAGPGRHRRRVFGCAEPASETVMSVAATMIAADLETPILADV